MVPRYVTVALALAAAPALAADGLDAAIGKALFERNWIPAPASTKADDGLGPLYDAPSCASCHQRRDTGTTDEDSVPPGLVVRLGNAQGGGDPVYGRQLQTRAVNGHTPEGNPDIEWQAKDALRLPDVTLYSLGYGALALDTKIGLRRAPSVFGAATLERIPESEIVKHADPDDADRDGVKGRAAFLTIDGKRVLGRFGWKSTEPDLPSQIAIAFSRDIGMSTTRHPEPWGECTEAETQCRAGPHGAEAGEVEIPDTLVDAIAAYLRTLDATPKAASNALGAKVFADAGCGACHRILTDGFDKQIPAYTDLLLHDLGAALNDGIKEGAANPGEWRTAPLWNTAANLRFGGLLHDGRARTVAEAIAWHGGEANAARTRFGSLSAEDKAALVAFVAAL